MEGARQWHRRILANQKRLFPEDPEIEAKARHYASQIRQERVDLNSLITNDAKTVGAEHVAISQMNEYGLDKILHGLDFIREQITYSKMLIVGRMVHPGSECETVRWVSKTSGVGELLGAEVKRYDTALHRTEGNL